MRQNRSMKHGTAAAQEAASPITGKPVPSAQARAEGAALDLLKVAFGTLSRRGQDEVIRQLRAVV